MFELLATYNKHQFYTVLGDNAAHEATAAALSSAKGMLRSELVEHSDLESHHHLNSF